MPLLNIDIIVNNVSRRFGVQEVVPGTHHSLSHYCSKDTIHEGNSEVQSGAAALLNGRCIRAVCKFARGNLSRLRHEARLYDDPHHLRNLQGAEVPWFFGYYECEIEEDGSVVPMGCMILEHCGEAIPRELLSNDLMKYLRLYASLRVWLTKSCALRGRVYTALAAIHKFGHLKHGDFGPSCRHILLRGSEKEKNIDIRIIDFDWAIDHECGEKMKVQLWAWEPKTSDYGCGELYDTVWMLGIWTPSIIHFMGFETSIFRVATVERLVKWTMYRNKHLREDYVERSARRALFEYYNAYKNRFRVIGHPMDYMEPLGIPGLPEDEEELPRHPFPEVNWQLVDL